MRVTKDLNWLLIAVVGGLLLAACGGSDEGSTASSASTTADTTTTLAPTTSITAATTTTAPAPTTTAQPTVDDYPVVDTYVVETVLSGLDSAAGGLAIDGEGVLYTADFGYEGHVGDTVFRVSSDGAVEEFATSELMDSLTGNTFGPDGVLYQSSFGSGNILTIGQDGSVELLTDELRGPTAIVVTEDGRVFAEDCRRNTVYEVFSDGSVENFASGAGMNCPNGMTIDPDGNLYVVSFSAGFMQRITPDGDIEVIHRFPGPNAHVVYWEGYLFVTARLDRRVYRYDLDSAEVVVIAGTGEDGIDDGPGPQATFGRPNAIAVGSDGTLYINHGSGNANNPSAIRAIKPVP